MLGHKLVQKLGHAFEVSTTIRSSWSDVARFGIFDESNTFTNVDVNDLSRVIGCIEATEPDVVVNAVGIIKQLPNAQNVEDVLSLNSIFPNRLSTLASKYGFRLICISTDCVFSGDQGGYRESDIPDARDLYGQSKRWGEVDAANCLTIRTSIIGRELSSSHSLVEWFLTNRGATIKGFSNAIYSGFPTVVFADIIRRLIAEMPGLAGIYHISSDPINKFDLLTLVRNEFRLDIEIERDETFRIDRSLDSSRFRQLSGFIPSPWSEMIAEMASDQTPYDKWKNQEF